MLNALSYNINMYSVLYTLHNTHYSYILCKCNKNWLSIRSTSVIKYKVYWLICILHIIYVHSPTNTFRWTQCILAFPSGLHSDIILYFKYLYSYTVFFRLALFNFTWTNLPGFLTSMFHFSYRTILSIFIPKKFGKKWSWNANVKVVRIFRIW